MTISGKRLAAMLAASCAAGVATGTPVAPPAAPRTYILNGFRLSGVKGVDPDALVARLKDKEGARVTEADIVADTKALGVDLKARHIDGQLFTTMAEKNGRVWVLFDFKSNDAAPGEATRRVASQNFEGDKTISGAALETATGLKPGDALPDSRLRAAAQAIIGAYHAAMPAAHVKVKARMKTTQDGKVTINWLIDEGK